ncbi:MAG: chorismate-binding protein [Micrococcus sp.]|nr:chorismate-binding protein [Micrococcus sp.]
MSASDAVLTAPLRALGTTAEAEEFSSAVIWAHEGTVTVGLGGWTVLVSGTDRVHRLSALWRAAVEASGIPDDAPREAARAWISSTFSDDSEQPSVLRVPAAWVTVTDGAGPVHHTQHVTDAGLAVAVASDPHVSLRAATVPVPDAPEADASGARGWSDAQYAAAIETLLERFSAEPLHKVVLSRTEDVPVTEAALWRAVARLHERYPQTWVFAVGGLLGATPEMLATRRGGRIESLVLAGSVERGADAAADAEARARLLEDASLAEEHHWAAQSVLDALAEVIDVEEQAEPFVLSLPNVHHLATTVRGPLRDASGTVLDVVARMHPTAAVGGTPSGEALAIIEDVEPVDRGRYAGPVGWLDHTGDGEIALALRCGQVMAGRDGLTLRLHAGGGIVPGSHPAAEVAEIAAKFAPMRRALGL